MIVMNKFTAYLNCLKLILIINFYVLFQKSLKTNFLSITT
jgi:hypothetical protein